MVVLSYWLNHCSQLYCLWFVFQLNCHGVQSFEENHAALVRHLWNLSGWSCNWMDSGEISCLFWLPSAASHDTLNMYMLSIIGLTCMQTWINTHGLDDKQCLDCFKILIHCCILKWQRGSANDSIHVNEVGMFQVEDDKFLGSHKLFRNPKVEVPSEVQFTDLHNRSECYFTHHLFK